MYGLRMNTYLQCGLVTAAKSWSTLETRHRESTHPQTAGAEDLAMKGL